MAWRDAQKIQAEADEKKAYEINIAKINADRPKTETDRQGQDRGLQRNHSERERVSGTSSSYTIATDILPPGYGYSKSLKLLSEFKEQFINTCSDELAVYLLKRGPKDLAELTTMGSPVLDCTQATVEVKSKIRVQPTCAEQKNTTV